MTKVRFDYQARANGPNAQVTGSLRFTPSGRQIEGTHIVVPAAFTTRYENTPLTVELAALPTGMAWQIREYVPDGVEWYAVVPESTEVVEAASLTPVDPDTLDPTTPVIPAYQALIDGAEQAAKDYADEGLTGKQDKAALDDDTAALVDGDGATAAALGATFLRHAVTIATLPTTGILSFHRGSGASAGSPGACAIAPEMTMSAYRLAAAMGANILDVDYQQTADGALLALHDPTVNRTTAGIGNLADYAVTSVPKVYMPEIVGNGWDPEPMPTIEEILREFGGRVVLTIETKGGAAGVPRLADLIHQYGLTECVYINGYDLATMDAIVAAGCRAHIYGNFNTPSTVMAVASHGVSLIELAPTCADDVVQAAIDGGIDRYIAGPVKNRTELAAVNPLLQGYVTDAPGYVGRPSGAVRSENSIGGYIALGHRGPGWQVLDQASRADWLTTAGILMRDGGSFVQYVRLGNVSGTPAVSGSITMKFRIDTPPTQTGDRIFMRVLCPEENGTAVDADTRGYVVSLRANGQLNMWQSPAGYGGGTALGASPTGVALVAGTEYSLQFEWTGTQVRATRVDSGATTGWVNSTAWRGDYHYLGTTYADGQVRATNLTVN